jgi:hypothetical protein
MKRCKVQRSFAIGPDETTPRQDPRGDARGADSPKRTAWSAEALWRGRYRQIEQTLALLVHDPDLDGETMRRAAIALDAHLSAVDSILYPMVESTRRAPLAEQRALSGRLRLLLAKATKSGIDRGTRQRRLRALGVSFREHVRLDEESLFPYLQAELEPTPPVARMVKTSSSARDVRS